MDRSQIRTYQAAECVSFRSTKAKFGGLSNMAGGYPLRVNGIFIYSAEALYQACRFPHKQEIQKLIIDQKSPMTAKMVSKPHRHETRPDWMQIRVRVMRWVLRVKLAMHWLDFGDLLLETGDRPIVEDSRRDEFWGALRQDDGTLVGTNALGRLLMELRDEIKGPDKENLRLVDPPPICDFLLYGEPIRQTGFAPAATILTDPDASPRPGTFWELPHLESESTEPQPVGQMSVPVGTPTATADTERITDQKMKYPKRLIEVDLPIKRISAHARREKSIRHGHISTLHIWWARRPLAACRAVVCASLWPDPGDPNCPKAFVETATRLMTYWGREQWGKCSEDSYPRLIKISKTPERLKDAAELRKALLDFIADFANWDNSTDAQYLAVARALTVAAHDALEGQGSFRLPKSITVDSLNEAIKDAPRPLLVDPFAGGGAIPLEGLRCGADAFASDLNPVAVLLNKVVLEYIPKYGNAEIKMRNAEGQEVVFQGLADAVAYWGNWMKEQAEKELAEFYPKDDDGATPIAYLWARTITCEGPGCGTQVPLMRSLWLAQKGENSVAVQIVPEPDDKRCDFVIIKKEKGRWVYQDEPKRTCEKPKFDGTVARGSATCPCCGFTTPVKSVRAQLKTRNGGANDAWMFAVVTTRPAQKGRFFRSPTGADRHAFDRAGKELERRKAAHAAQLSLIPDEKVDAHHHDVNRLPMYGMTCWGDAFNLRQLLSLSTFGMTLRQVQHDSTDKELMGVVSLLLAFAVDRQADYTSSLCSWAGDFIRSSFGRQALAMVWDYAEVNPLSVDTGGFSGAVSWVLRVLSRESIADNSPGQSIQEDATRHSLPDDSAQMLFTDPPYYDAIDYAVISDFYYVWLRRNIEQWHGVDLSLQRAPIAREIVVDSTTTLGHGIRDAAFYQELMAEALTHGRRYVTPCGIGTIVFAHKSTSGWETQIESLITAGWTVSASWPIDTERPGRMRAIDSAALASSVHLVCRPREDKDGNIVKRVGDWRDVLSELPGRIAQWLPRLASEGVVGADAIFACLGPALEIFSRYSSVEKASGEVVPLREYLEQVWAEVARQALNMIFEGADASGFEEDARLTAMWLWTLRTDANGNGEDDDKTTSLPGYSLEYDAARKIAQGLGCHLENLSQLVETKGDTAMLLSAESRARYLFGKTEGGVQKAKGRKKKDEAVQQDLFSILGLPSEEEAEAEQAELERPPAGKTVLDQLHQAMLLFTAGRGQALKRFLVDDGIGTNPQFWTLAQALSALYPAHTNEKRWVDGVLARKKGLGF